MSVERIAWIVAVVVAAALAALCFLIGYSGYGWTVVAIAIAAAANLLPEAKTDGVDPESPDPGQPFGQ